MEQDAETSLPPSFTSLPAEDPAPSLTTIKTSTKSSRGKNNFWEIAQTILFAFILAQLIIRFLVQPHQVEGASMEPNFHSGDFILTDKITYRFRPPQRGEVVIFHPPNNPKVEYIKRIIALPGEKISINQGQIYINGQKLKEEYLPRPYNILPADLIQGKKELIVPPQSYFVLGDNRTSSYDSRFFGVVEKQFISGRALFRYWPPQRVQAFFPPHYQLQFSPAPK